MNDETSPLNPAAQASPSSAVAPEETPSPSSAVAPEETPPSTMPPEQLPGDPIAEAAQALLDTLTDRERTILEERLSRNAPDLRVPSAVIVGHRADGARASFTRKAGETEDQVRARCAAWVSGAK